MAEMLMIACVVAANTLGGMMAVPQALALYRTRNTSGVSAEWAAMSASVNLWWGVYAIAVGNPALLPVSIVSVTAYVTIAIGLLMFRPGGRATTLRRLIQGCLVALIPLPVVAAFGWAITGVALGALYAVQLTPAVVSVYRTHDVSGVSVGTWLLALVEAALWAVYALPIRDAGLLTLAAAGIGMSGLVLARLLVKRPRRDGVGAVAFAQ